MYCVQLSLLSKAYLQHFCFIATSFCVEYLWISILDCSTLPMSIVRVLLAVVELFKPATQRHSVQIFRAIKLFSEFLITFDTAISFRSHQTESSGAYVLGKQHTVILKVYDEFLKDLNLFIPEQISEARERALSASCTEKQRQCTD